MKCTENCPAFWVQGGGGYEYPDEVDCYGCQIYGMYRGSEGDHCNLTKNQIEKKLEELEVYEMGEIDRPNWVAMRFIHDMDDAGDCGLPQFPPKRCYVEKIENDIFEEAYYVTNMKSLYGSTDLHFAQYDAYQKGYEDAKDGKEFDRFAEWLKELKGYRSIKDQIAFAKRNIRSENSDYLTGYISALSAVEGMIAEIENAESEE